jgi:D-alanine-D-alanine ligase
MTGTTTQRGPLGGRATEIRLGELRPRERGRLFSLVCATGVFREDEVAIAVELFDETFGDGASAAEHEMNADRREITTTDHENDSAVSSDYRFLGAFRDDLMVGYACYGWTPGTVATWDLYWIAVDPAMHGAGVGTALMGEVEHRLHAERARLVVVETSSRSDYAPTRRFYERLGYDEVARVRDFYAPGDDRIILVKRFHVPDEGEGAESP